MPRLKDKYDKEVVSLLNEKFAYKNVMEIPKIVKVVVNMGVGDAVADPKMLDVAANDLL